MRLAKEVAENLLNKQANKPTSPPRLQGVPFFYKEVTACGEGRRKLVQIRGWFLMQTWGLSAGSLF